MGRNEFMLREVPAVKASKKRIDGNAARQACKLRQETTPLSEEMHKK